MPSSSVLTMRRWAQVLTKLNTSVFLLHTGLFFNTIFFFFTALFYLIWCAGPDLHDDVPSLAECSPGQGELHPVWSRVDVNWQRFFFFLYHQCNFFVPLSLPSSRCVPKSCGTLSISVMGTSWAWQVMMRITCRQMMTLTPWGEFCLLQHLLKCDSWFMHTHNGQLFTTANIAAFYLMGLYGSSIGSFVTVLFCLTFVCNSSTIHPSIQPSMRRAWDVFLVDDVAEMQAET